MNCPQAELQLNALADHELPPWQALRVRRHVAACPACAAEYADIQRFDASVQAGRDIPTPFTLGPRIAALLPPSAAFQTSRRTFPIRPAAVGLAGVTAAVAAVFWFLPGQPGEPTIAYADVVKAMANVKIMGLTKEDTNYYANGKIFHHHTEETWVRVNPPMVATIRFPTVTHPFREQLLETANGTTVMDQDGNYYITDNIHKVADDVNYEISHYAQSWDELATPGNNDPFGTKGSAKILVWERTTLHGQPVVKFMRSSSGMDLYPAVHPGLLPQQNVVVDSNVAFWISSRTHRILQYENDTTAHGKPDFNLKWYNISYDQMPPPGIFVNFPPPGAKVVDKRRRLKQIN